MIAFCQPVFIKDYDDDDDAAGQIRHSNGPDTA